MTTVSDRRDGFLTSDDGVVHLHTLDGLWSDQHTIESRRALTKDDAQQLSAFDLCAMAL
jgi:hypothetical protein